MALPRVATLLDCTDLTQTVYPFLHQLSLAHVQSLLRREVSPLAWYTSTNPLVTAVWFALAVSAVVFVAAEINRNYSQVDRLWGLLPTVYIAHFTVYAHLVGGDTQRLNTLLTFAVLWSARLTFNYWRKGGYNIGSEDYRWEILRGVISPPLFVVFDAAFIATFQNLLLLSIAFPAYILLVASRLPKGVLPSFTTADTLASYAVVVLLALETLADQQQWTFQTAKASYRFTGIIPARSEFSKEDLERGFVVTGLWSFSRHPNFLCEQAIWVTVYQWSCLATDSVYNWSGVGAAAYLALFAASTRFTENISVRKYDEYREYQARVNRFVPAWGAFIGLSEPEAPPPRPTEDRKWR